jgi:TP53 regulating kinase-like protein
MKKEKKRKIIAQGAEALLIKKGNILVKDRIVKGYRHKKIDSFLRKKRTRSEARIISKVSLIIDVPKIKKVSENKIEMDFIQGERLSGYLDKMSEKKALVICKIIGRNVATLHDIDVIHGDLTTSNMILQDKKVFFIDFGLAFHSHRIENKAVDLHLLRQAFESKHFKRWNKYFSAVLSGYKKSVNSEKVLMQLEKVKMRGRYKEKQQRKKK